MRTHRDADAIESHDERTLRRCTAAIVQVRVVGRDEHGNNENGHHVEQDNADPCSSDGAGYRASWIMGFRSTDSDDLNVAIGKSGISQSTPKAEKSTSGSRDKIGYKRTLMITGSKSGSNSDVINDTCRILPIAESNSIVRRIATHRDDKALRSK